MTDTLTVQSGQVTLTTEEGARFEETELSLDEMFQSRFVPPLGGLAWPDGVKFAEWREPRLVVVHQNSPCKRRLKWIAADSPKPYGPGTQYRYVEVSLPYAITFAVFDACGNRLRIGPRNELYFVNRPLRSLNDSLGYPALLNVSKVNRNGRKATWICVQHLKAGLEMDWTQQLDALVQHCFDGAFNLSSEHHEGSSWYKESSSIAGLHPIEEWSRCSKEDPLFALNVEWLPAPLNVGEMIEALLTEPRTRLGKTAPTPATKEFHVIPRYLNFLQTRKKKPK